MLDLKFIRENIDLVRQAAVNPRGNPVPPTLETNHKKPPRRRE
jgi:hypothetical protein